MIEMEKIGIRNNLLIYSVVWMVLAACSAWVKNLCCRTGAVEC